MRSVTTFIVLTVVVFVGAAVGVAAVPGADSPSKAVSVDAQLPELESPEPVTDEGIATLDGTEYDTIQAAADAAEPGATVRLSGRFDEQVRVDTPNLTLVVADGQRAVIDGGGEGDVLTIDAPGVTVEELWVRNSGWNANTEDAGIFVNSSDARLDSLRLTDVTFGVWVNGVDRVTVTDSTISGRPSVESRTDRGNGIHLWETEDTVVRGNNVTSLRDGIYFSWAEGVEAADNRLWNLRYGVHYMYSNDNLLSDNLAVDNDVGYALMVSERLELRNNTAVDNRGQSGHGIMIKDIENTTISGSVLADNDNGVFMSNSQDIRVVSNLVLENGIGIHATAGSTGETVRKNSFVHNDMQAFTTRNDIVAWNGSGSGNYWSDARTVDRTADGVSEIRHRPAGAVERLLHDNPQAAVFTESPAFAAVRMAEDSFPIVESPGIIDHHPLVDSPHDYQQYYGDSNARSRN